MKEKQNEPRDLLVENVMLGLVMIMYETTNIVQEHQPLRRGIESSLTRRISLIMLMYQVLDLLVEIVMLGLVTLHGTLEHPEEVLVVPRDATI